MKVPCKYNPGDKIFAKVKGFVYWPARVNPLPSDIVIPPNKIPIFFYGTHEVYFISPTSCWPFDEKNKSKWGKPRPRAYFNQGMDEIENYSTIYQYGVDPLAEDFLSQFYEFKKSDGQNTTPNKFKQLETVGKEEVDENKDVIKKSNKKRNKSGSSAGMKENKTNVNTELTAGEIKTESTIETKDEAVSTARKRRVSESALSSKENESNDAVEKSENADDEDEIGLSTRKRQKSDSSSTALTKTAKSRKSYKKKSKPIVAETKPEKSPERTKTVKDECVVDGSLISNSDKNDENVDDFALKQENHLHNSPKSEPDVQDKVTCETNHSDKTELKPTTRCRAKSSSTKISNNQSVTSSKMSEHDSESPSVDSDNLADEDFRPAYKVKRLAKKAKNLKPAKQPPVKKSAPKPKRTPKPRGNVKKKANFNVDDEDSLSSISSIEDFKTKLENQKKEYEEKLKNLQLQQFEMEEIAVKEASRRSKAKRISDSLAVVNEVVDDGKEKISNENNVCNEPDVPDCKLEKEVAVNIIKDDNILDGIQMKYDVDNIKDDILQPTIEEDTSDKECDTNGSPQNELTLLDASCKSICSDKAIDWSEPCITKLVHVVDEVCDLSSNVMNEFVPAPTMAKKDDHFADTHSSLSIDRLIDTPPNKKQDHVDESLPHKEIENALETSTGSGEKIKKVKINLKDLKINKNKSQKAPPANRKRNRKLSSSISSDSDIEIIECKQKESGPKVKRSKILERNCESNDNKKETKNGDKGSVDKLQILHNFNADIRSSLVLGHEDNQICLERFKSLCEMDIDLLTLVKVWQLMDTVKKCRRYKRNEQVKQEAQAVYKRFMDIYSRASKEEINTAQSLLMQYRHQNNIQNQNVGIDSNKPNGNTSHGLTIPFSVADMFQNKQSCQPESNSSKARPINKKEVSNPEKPCTPGHVEEPSKSRPNPTEEEINEEKMRLLAVDLEAKVSDILNKIEKNVDINPINQKSLSHLLPSSDDNAVIKLPTQWKTVNDKNTGKDKSIEEEISDDDEEDVEAIVRRIEEVAIKLPEPEIPDLSISNGNSSALDVRIENLINSSFISTKDSRQRKSRTSSRHHKTTKASSPPRGVGHSKSDQADHMMNISDIELPTEPAPQLEEQKDDIEIYDLLGV